MGRDREKRERLFRLVPIDRAMEWVERGWMPDDRPAPGPHGAWRVFVEWLCDCPPLEPPLAPQAERGGHGAAQQDDPPP